MASPAAARLTPHRSWLIAFAVEPAPGRSPTCTTFEPMALRASLAREKSSSLAPTMMVSAPEVAPTTPPDTGASMKPKPAARTRLASACAFAGGQVAMTATTAPGASRAMALESNRTDSA